jgi:AmmeMemoRadiSam system protein B/AmmeMemoRadiSam system protein A
VTVSVYDIYRGRFVMLREPAVAGKFYPDSPGELRALIESFVDKEARQEEVIGLISPHAGYIYSGAVAGATISRVKFKNTFIIIGPNHTGSGEPYSIMAEGKWKTPLGTVEIDSALAKKLLSESAYLREDNLAHCYEHSLEVQIPFLQYFKPDIKIVPIILASNDRSVFKSLGHEIARVLGEIKREAVILASSDMSHYEPQAKTEKKDRQAIAAILNLDGDELLKRVEEHHITMCGYGPAIVMLAAAKELGAGKAELVKYQTSGDVSGDYSAVVGYAGIIVRKLSPLVQLAREALEAYVKEKKVLHPGKLTPEMKGRAGVFVCIKKFAELRGCIGTFEPTRDNIAEEIVTNAISTATQDPRFERVRPDELKDLAYTVDVLTHPEPIESKDQLDPRKYGVIVEAGYRRGLLLPDLEGVDSADYQIEICRQKGGIGPDEPVKLYRFEVKRYQ